MCVINGHTFQPRLGMNFVPRIMPFWNYDLRPNSAVDISKSVVCTIMFETRVNLGNGIIKNLSSILVDEQGVPLENIWGTIEEFGIKRDELKKLDPSYKELFEIYSAIRAYRVSVRYLKQLKTRFA